MNTNPSIQQIIAAFKQGRENNCATVAIIKAAIAQYGIRQVYTSTANADGTFSVTLKDTSSIQLQADDFDTLGPEGGFISLANDKDSQNILRYAQNCFIVMVRNYMQRENASLNSALNHLNKKGLDSDYAYQYLGITDGSIVRLEFTDTGTQELGRFTNEPLYLLYNLNHIGVANLNNYDEYGTLTSINEFQRNHAGTGSPGLDFWAYRFV